MKSLKPSGQKRPHAVQFWVRSPRESETSLTLQFEVDIQGTEIRLVEMSQGIGLLL